MIDAVFVYWLIFALVMGGGYVASCVVRACDNARARKARRS